MFRLENTSATPPARVLRLGLFWSRPRYQLYLPGYFDHIRGADYFRGSPTSHRFQLPLPGDLSGTLLRVGYNTSIRYDITRTGETSFWVWRDIPLRELREQAHQLTLA